VNAYWPTDTTVVAAVAGCLGLALVTSLALMHLKSRILGRATAWLLVFAGVAGVNQLTTAQPPGFRMLAIIGVLLLCMKGVVLFESNHRLRLSSWFGFTALWIGMRPALFTDVPGPPRGGSWDLVRLGLKHLVLGAALIVLARLAWLIPGDRLSEGPRRLLATVLLLPGISLALHFGVFNLLAGSWRFLGAKSRPLFRAPIQSKSLTEFWGQRWNLAFAEMTAIGVFRPLRYRLGPRVATTVAFLFSGLLHELAISVPVNAGYGRPMLYFALHGLGMTIENGLDGRGRPIHRRPLVGRLWTMAWILLPLPILFHPPFLNGCVWPLIGMDSP
jgi:alginate O-acetyltransferase complex protein AlgI